MRRNFRRALSLRPVVYSKEIVDSTNIGVAAGTNTDVNLATAVNTYAGAVGTCPIGARINGIYLFCQIIPESAQGNVDWYVMKAPGNQIGTKPTPGATGGASNRKWIIHEEKGIPGSFNNGASPLTFKGVIKLPRKMRRMGEDDLIFLRFRGATVIDCCIKAIYKWYQ